MEDVQCHGGYFEDRGDTLSTVGMLSTIGNIMINVGGYWHFPYSVPRGDIMIHVWGMHSTSTFIIISPHSTECPPYYSRWPHGTEHTNTG